MAVAWAQQVLGSPAAVQPVGTLGYLGLAVPPPGWSLPEGRGGGKAGDTWRDLPAASFSAAHAEWGRQGT